MKSALIFKYICLMLTFLLVYNNIPMICTAHAATDPDSVKTINENSLSPGITGSVNADSGKNNESDSIIIR
ncbi:MAG: hypothetical protein QME74_10125, partial [Candidatus Edwardsbacteria bacterium]|nr:hypothetical protein [Candidatus Edwardsbacteria bacterium]